VRRAAAAALLAACGLGCALTGSPRPDAFYRLEPAAPPPLARPALPGLLEVDRLRADAITSERLLLFRAGDDATEVRRHAYHQWVDPPPLMLQVALASALRGAGVARAVVTSDQRARPDFVLGGRILRLERRLDGPPRALLELELSLTRESDRALLLQRVYREERAAEGAAVADAVRAFDAALGALLERLVADLASSEGSAGSGTGPPEP
jgi:ABC-type uncharacterized transport system auxiliary subunit